MSIVEELPAIWCGVQAFRKLASHFNAVPAGCEFEHQGTLYKEKRQLTPGVVVGTDLKTRLAVIKIKEYLRSL